MRTHAEYKLLHVREDVLLGRKISFWHINGKIIRSDCGLKDLMLLTRMILSHKYVMKIVIHSEEFRIFRLMKVC